MYKEFLKNDKKSNDPVKKWAMDLNKEFSKEEIKMAMCGDVIL